MAVAAWAPIASRQGVNQVSPALAVPQGSTKAYARMTLDGSSTFSKAAGAGQHLDFAIQWSSDPALPPAEESFQHLGGGGFDGGAPAQSKSGFFDTEVVLPSGCTYVRAFFSTINGPIRFGVSGEFRS